MSLYWKHNYSKRGVQMQITVKQLSKTYKDKTILDNITFTIESGTVSGLLGVNITKYLDF